ncbi:MAG: sulfurtransferase TusC [Gammaproteobacteria bacterium]|nr:sulfurtransferase TusC [Gammaproteobacteria bacterium]
MKNRSILLMLRTSPYRGVRFGEALDALLVAAAFEQRCTVLLLDDAVFALLPDQHGDVLGRRTAAKLLNALPDYEVERICVCEESLAQRGLINFVDTLSATRLTPAQQTALIAAHDIVWND